MIPEWVATLEQYCEWLERVAENSGGLPDPHYVLGEDLPVVERLGLGYRRDMLIDTHAIVFPSVGRLTYRLLVSEALDYDGVPDGIEQVGYSFHFQTDDEPLVWRYDKHEGHPEVGLCHVHRGDEDRRFPSGEMDLELVIDEINQGGQRNR